MRPTRSVLGLSCLLCGRLYSTEEVDYVCPHHGGAATLSVVYDYEYLAGLTSPDQIASDPDRSIWRYRQLLPVSPDADPPPLQVGGTPLLRGRVLERGLKVRLWVKDEGRQPTASLKDRASALAVLKARKRGQALSPPPAPETPGQPWPPYVPLPRFPASSSCQLPPPSRKWPSCSPSAPLWLS